MSWEHLRRRFISQSARLKWHLSGLMTSGFTSTTNPIFVGGCPRSGTTLMRVILDSHPHICCGPESYLWCKKRIKIERLAQWFDMREPAVSRLLLSTTSRAQFIDKFHAEYCKVTGKARWAEKTPKNVRFLDLIFKHFPQSRFIHMVRDPRDAVCSLRTHPKYRLVNGKTVESNRNRNIAQCAKIWVKSVTCGLQFSNDPRYVEIRYEDLILNTEPTLRRLFEALNEPWDERVLKFYEEKNPSRNWTRDIQNPKTREPIQNNAMGRWKKDLSPDELADVLRIAGPLMERFGYQKEPLENAQPAISA